MSAAATAAVIGTADFAAEACCDSFQLLDAFAH